MRGVQPVGGIRRYRELQLLLHVRVLPAHPGVARSRAEGRAAALHGDCSRVESRRVAARGRIALRRHRHVAESGRRPPQLLIDCGRSDYRVRATGPEMLDFLGKGVEI